MDIQEKRLQFEDELLALCSMSELHTRADLANRIAIMSGYFYPSESPQQKHLDYLRDQKQSYIKQIVDKYFPE